MKTTESALVFDRYMRVIDKNKSERIEHVYRKDMLNNMIEFETDEELNNVEEQIKFLEEQMDWKIKEHKEVPEFYSIRRIA